VVATPEKAPNAATQEQRKTGWSARKLALLTIATWAFKAHKKEIPSESLIASLSPVAPSKWRTPLPHSGGRTLSGHSLGLSRLFVLKSGKTE
jgi:hypothetical protein